MSKKRGTYDQPQSLMLETVRLIQGKDLLALYAETSVPYYWLRQFSRGAYKNPSVNRVQYLYEHLTNSKLVN
jgi:hypothetical protein